jgi:hypothetical protein
MDLRQSGMLADCVFTLGGFGDDHILSRAHW